MDKKDFAKRYLIITLSMLTVLTILSALILYALDNSNLDTISLSSTQRLFLSLAAGYAPTASFSGFCICFKRVSELNTYIKLALTVFFPVSLAVITLVGVVMLVPSMVKSAADLISR